MYPPKFDYHRAASVEEAIALLQEHDGAKLLAGGHSLIPVMKLRLADPGVLIDIGRIPGMSGISSSNGTTSIGAMTTHAQIIAESDSLPAAMHDAATKIADQMVRNRGTLGGNIAHADPASDWPTVLVALGATINIQGPNGSRSMSADDFFVDLFETGLDDYDVITSIDIPSADKQTGTAYAKMFNQASRYALVGAAVSLTMQGNTCTAATVALGSATPSAMRCPSAEAALVGNKVDDDSIAAAAAAAATDVDEDMLVGDIHASASYRKQMIPVYVARALSSAASRG